RIASPEAARALAAAREKAKGPARAAIADAWLRCADRRRQEGKNAEAAAIYQELNRPEEPRPVRLAALRGELRSAGGQAGALVLALIGGTDADARTIAIGQIADLSPAALKTVAAGLGRLPPAGQVTVLGALAARGGRSQLPVALAAVKGQDESV